MAVSSDLSWPEDVEAGGVLVSSLAVSAGGAVVVVDVVVSGGAIFCGSSSCFFTGGAARPWLQVPSASPPAFPGAAALGSGQAAPVAQLALGGSGARLGRRLLRHRRRRRSRFGFESYGCTQGLRWGSGWFDTTHLPHHQGVHQHRAGNAHPKQALAVLVALAKCRCCGCVHRAKNYSTQQVRSLRAVLPRNNPIV